MARPKGLLQIKGTLGDLSFYDSVYGPIVRTKGGPSAQQIAKGKNFVRVREHNAEFKGCALSGKTLRHALRPLLVNLKDHRLVWRVTKLMSDLKNQDVISVRGKRTVMQGLTKDEGKSILKNFDFNSQATLNKVLVKPYKLDKTQSVLSIKGFKPLQDLRFPKGATHVSLKCALLRADLVKGKTELFESKELKLKLDKKASDVSLTVVGEPSIKGVTIYLLQICFLQEINGSEYPLNNGVYTVLNVIGVGEVY